MRGIWNTSPARLGLPGIVAGVLGSLMASSACATTYLYVGQPYTSVGYYDGTATPVSGPAPAPYGPAMRVTGSFTTNARLPANLGTLKNIGPTGLNLMNGWKFNDGLLSYADGNSALVPTISGAIRRSAKPAGLPSAPTVSETSSTTCSGPGRPSRLMPWDRRWIRSSFLAPRGRRERALRIRSLAPRWSLPWVISVAMHRRHRVRR